MANYKGAILRFSGGARVQAARGADCRIAAQNAQGSPVLLPRIDAPHFQTAQVLCGRTPAATELAPALPDRTRVGG